MKRLLYWNRFLLKTKSEWDELIVLLLELFLFGNKKQDMLTGKEEIPYWIEGAVPERPIDIWGIAGRVPNGLLTGSACATAELWGADLIQTPPASVKKEQKI